MILNCCNTLWYNKAQILVNLKFIFSIDGDKKKGEILDIWGKKKKKREQT